MVDIDLKSFSRRKMLKGAGGCVVIASTGIAIGDKALEHLLQSRSDSGHDKYANPSFVFASDPRSGMAGFETLPG